MQVVCSDKRKQMVPWQRSHSHLLNNGDKRRNKQNLSKKINVDTQGFSFCNEKQALTPTASALSNGSQPSTSLGPTKNFPAGEKNPIYRRYLTNPSAADLYVNSHAGARHSVHRYRAEHTDTSQTRSLSPGPAAQAPSPHSEAAAAAHFGGNQAHICIFAKQRKEPSRQTMSSHRSIWKKINKWF